MGKTIKKIVDDYTEGLDLTIVDEILQDKELGDFEMNKSTLLNIGEWALNGESNAEIRKRLDLKPKQWELLCSICPVVVYIMRDSRALADVVIAGSLVQTAIGGKRVRKQVVKTVTDYDERGKPCGQHLETIELWEELPPNPILLKFLAEHKLSDKFGDKKVDNSEKFAQMINEMTPEERAIIESSAEQELLDGEN